MGHQIQRQASPTLDIIDGHPDMAYTLASSLREADKKEVLAVYDIDPDNLAHALADSIQLAIKEDGHVHGIVSGVGEDKRLIGLFGYGDFSTDRLYPNGCIWLVSTDELFEKHALTTTKIFIRYLLPQLLLKYGSVGNYVLAENHVHIDWLTMCGFRKEHTRVIGKEPFILMRRDL